MLNPQTLLRVVNLEELLMCFSWRKVLEKSCVSCKARILKMSFNSVSPFARRRKFSLFFTYHVMKKDDPRKHALDYFVEKS